MAMEEPEGRARAGVCNSRFIHIASKVDIEPPIGTTVGRRSHHRSRPTASRWQVFHQREGINAIEQSRKDTIVANTRVVWNLSCEWRLGDGHLEVNRGAGVRLVLRSGARPAAVDRVVAYSQNSLTRQDGIACQARGNPILAVVERPCGKHGSCTSAERATREHWSAQVTNRPSRRNRGTWVNRVMILKDCQSRRQVCSEDCPWRLSNKATSRTGNGAIDPHRSSYRHRDSQGGQACCRLENTGQVRHHGGGAGNVRQAQNRRGTATRHGFVERVPSSKAHVVGCVRSNQPPVPIVNHGLVHPGQVGGVGQEGFPQPVEGGIKRRDNLWHEVRGSKCTVGCELWIGANRQQAVASIYRLSGHAEVEEAIHRTNVHPTECLHFLCGTQVVEVDVARVLDRQLLEVLIVGCRLVRSQPPNRIREKAWIAGPTELIAHEPVLQTEACGQCPKIQRRLARLEPHVYRNACPDLNEAVRLALIPVAVVVVGRVATGTVHVDPDTRGVAKGRDRKIGAIETSGYRVVFA